MNNIEDLWSHILNSLKEKMSKPSYDTWLAETKPIELKDDLFIISVSSDFEKDWLIKRYKDIINELLYDITGAKLSIEFYVDNTDEAIPVEKPKIQPNDNPIVNMLNPKYTFDTFVVGAANRFAHAASLAVAEAPAKSYNPLFIYGGVGL